jgi:hypothetical protein
MANLKKIAHVLTVFSLIFCCSVLFINDLISAGMATCSADCGGYLVICGVENGTCVATDGVGCVGFWFNGSIAVIRSCALAQ